MSVRTLALALVLVGLSGCESAPPARTDVRVGIGVRVAPPPPRVIVVPTARRGHVYAPGHWRWNGRRYLWVNGHYLRERRGYVWVADRWEDRNGNWHYSRGHWERRR